MNPDVWLPAAPASSATARKRLIVIPHAGSGAAPWFGWREQLPDDVELRVARLPGREIRFGETPLTSAREVIAELARAVSSLSPLPLVIFGHSLGALLAYGVSASLRGAARALAVSGQTAPDRTVPHGDLLRLPDIELAAEASRRWHAVPTELLDEPEALAIFLPTLRADLALVDSCCAWTGTPLDIPLLVFAGTGDDLCADGVHRWAAYTRGGMRLVRHPGVHLAVLDDPAVATLIIRTCLGSLR